MIEIVHTGPLAFFRKQAEKEAKREVLKKGERIGQLIGLVGIIIVIIFFAYHLNKPTGFFTSAFGTFDAILFFGVNIFGIVPQIIRFVTNRRTPARPFDIINSVLFLIVLIYFLAKFPFDFSHVAEPLPLSLEFLLSWLSNQIASALMVLGVIGLLIALPIQTTQYYFIKNVPIATAEPAEKAPEPTPAEPEEETKAD